MGWEAHGQRAGREGTGVASLDMALGKDPLADQSEDGLLPGPSPVLCTYQMF